MASKGKGSGKPRATSTQPPSAKSDRRSSKNKDYKQKDDNKETLAWKILNQAQIKELADLETVENVQDKLSEMLSLTGHPIDLKEASTLEYFTAALWWAREQSFTHEQQSAMFTVVHTIMDNIKEKHLPLVENLKEFKKMLAGIGVEHSEVSGGLECFDIAQAKTISEYIYSSIFQHHKLYEFMFTHTQAEEIIGTDLEIETAPFANIPWPPPLEEGVCADIHRDHIATPPPTPPPQESTPEGAEGDTPDGSTGIDPQKEADLMAALSAEEVKGIINSVFNDMLGNVQADIAFKLREKENTIITRINKVHKVADKKE